MKHVEKKLKKGASIVVSYVYISFVCLSACLLPISVGWTKYVKFVRKKTDSFFSWNCFRNFTKLIEITKKEKYTKYKKHQDIVQNLHEIAFAHPYEIISNFRAIFTQNVSKSFCNYCTIFVQIISIGNPSYIANL